MYAAQATSLANVSGESVLIGLSGALQTLCGQVGTRCFMALVSITITSYVWQPVLPAHPHATLTSIPLATQAASCRSSHLALCRHLEPRPMARSAISGRDLPSSSGSHACQYQSCGGSQTSCCWPLVSSKMSQPWVLFFSGDTCCCNRSLLLHSASCTLSPPLPCCSTCGCHAQKICSNTLSLALFCTTAVNSHAIALSSPCTFSAAMPPASPRHSHAALDVTTLSGGAYQAFGHMLAFRPHKATCSPKGRFYRPC